MQIADAENILRMLSTFASEACTLWHMVCYRLVVTTDNEYIFDVVIMTVILFDHNIQMVICLADG